MARISEATKQRRVELVWQVVKQNNGIRESEIADQLKIHKRVVNNYLRDDLAKRVYKEGVLWYALDFQVTRLQKFELSAEEAFTLYLAARLFVKQSDKRNELAEKALNRLADRLTGTLSVGPEIRQAALELAQRPIQPDYQPIFQEVVRAYLLRRKLTLMYEPLRGEPFATTFSIYLIEPSEIGRSTYLIGHSHNEKVNALRSYKLERVLSAAMLPDAYDIPPDFPGLDILRNAWSIIIGEETVKVILRFHPRVVKRVRETQWHPTQKTHWETVAGGYLRWTVEVASTVDLFPWIRSWGRDVEIVAPSTLRRQYANELRQLNFTYQRTGLTPSPYHFLYAKTDRKTGQFIHLLLYHLIDVGKVAHALWNDALTSAFQEQIASILGLDGNSAGRFVAFLAALHDIGKAGPAYQNKYAPDWLRVELTSRGFDLNLTTYNHATQTQPHGNVAAWCLPLLLIDACKLQPLFAEQIAVALGGHHGKWPFYREFTLIEDDDVPAWEEARQALVEQLVRVFDPPSVEMSPEEEEGNVFLMLLSGLTSVADWLGSREDSFPFEDRALPTREYARVSAERAQSALHILGWQGWQPTRQTLNFSQMFAHLAEAGEKITPRPIQAAVIEAASDCVAPTLLILEAPTGSGKTETALYLADNWLQEQGGRGFYIAMPTQATSNQLFDRTVDFLRHRYPDQAININLAHSQWRLHAKARELTKRTLEEMRLHEVGDDEQDRIAAMSWFTDKSKRTLLAPFGVGTIDQALLSVLQTRHFFVRLFGLSHKVIIFDEVHAYDTYMLTLLEELLAWLQAVGTSVILLSATLPIATRRRLVRAYSWCKLTETTPHYPALTIARMGAVPDSQSLPAPLDKPLPLVWLSAPVQAEDDVAQQNVKIAEVIVEALRYELLDGGCAAVICNTVARAQAIFEAICADEQLGQIPAEDRILFHARFPVLWRKRDKEDVVLEKFGKPQAGRMRPKTAIVVATQVIEQSLDLDFDIMFTDLAPLDLLLQRAGRLQRHHRESRPRPKRLAIIEPLVSDNIAFGSSAYVYDEYHLLRTYHTLQQHPDPLQIPSETPHLIEQVYGAMATLPPLPKQVIGRITHAQRKLDETTKKERAQAKNRIILPPDAEDLLDDRYATLEEDDPKVGRALQAMTRLIPPSIALICLHRIDDQLFLEPEGGRPIVIRKKPNSAVIHDLLLRTINVTRREVVTYFRERPPDFPLSPALKQHRLLIFENGEWITPVDAPKPFKLRLTRRLGLEFLEV